LKLIIML